MEQLLRYIWNDSVWSKVIAILIGSFIIFIIRSIIGSIWKRFFQKNKTYISDEESVIDSLKTRQFRNGRTITGIIGDTGLSRDAILSELEELENKGIVKNKEGKKSTWSLTIKGKRKK